MTGSWRRTSGSQVSWRSSSSSRSPCFYPVWRSAQPDLRVSDPLSGISPKETLIPKQHDPAAEGAGLGEPEVDLDVRWLEQSVAVADEHGVHVEPVLVDQVELHEGRREGGPAEREVSTGLSFSCVTSVGTTSRTTVVFH